MIAIVGAGPVGIEAAVRILQDEKSKFNQVTVIEKGAVAQNVRDWGHVRMFSPWSLNTSKSGTAALMAIGKSVPDASKFPLASEYVKEYLEPLAEYVSKHARGTLLTNHTLVSVSRNTMTKGEAIGKIARHHNGFRILVEDSKGNEKVVHADIVFDCTGTFDHPNNFGAGGIPALNERRLHKEGLIEYHIPDVAKQADTYSGKSTLVIGSGYSALTSITQLIALKNKDVKTAIHWLTRRTGNIYTRIENDTLPQRDELAKLGNTLADGKDNGVHHIGGSTVTRVEKDKGQLRVFYVPADGKDKTEKSVVVDRIISNCGFHPDLIPQRELQVHYCYASEGPMKLAAALLGASGGDCLKQSVPGAETLTSPEPSYYILGAKSYGRGSAFLVKLGVEQIEAVLGLIAKL